MRHNDQFSEINGLGDDTEAQLTIVRVDEKNGQRESVGDEEWYSGGRIIYHGRSKTV